jgi:hypothetical protein
LITKFSVTAGSWPNWTKICDQFRLSVSGCAGNFWRINEQKKPCLEGTAELSPGFQPGFNPGTGVWTFFGAELANIKPEVEAWIAVQRLNRLAQVL